MKKCSCTEDGLDFGGGRVSELMIKVYDYKGSKILGSSVGVFLGVSIGDIKGFPKPHVDRKSVVRFRNVRS